MRKLIAPVLGFLLLLVFLTPAYGQSATPGGFSPERILRVREQTQQRQEEFRQVSEERRQEFQARQEEARREAEARLQKAREEAEQRREEVKRRIAEHRAEQLRSLLARLQERLNALIDRLETLSDRIQSRIDKFAAEGADTGDAQTQLDQARAKLAEVRGMVAALDGIGEDLVTAENPREFFMTLKDEILKIKATLREAHQLLASSVAEIRGFSEVEEGGSENAE